MGNKKYLIIMGAAVVSVVSFISSYIGLLPSFVVPFAIAGSAVTILYMGR